MNIIKRNRDGKITKGARRILRINTLMLEGTARSVAKAEKLKSKLKGKPEIGMMIRESITLRETGK